MDTPEFSSEGDTLRAAETLKPLFEQVRASLPPGTDFGLFLVVPKAGVVAVTTHRARVVRPVAEWVLNILPTLEA